MAAKQQVTFVISAKDKTRAAFRAIGRGVRKMRLGIASIVGGAAFGALTRQALSFAAALDAASQRLRVPVALLDSLQQQAKAFGATAETLNMVLQRLATRAGEAVNGSSKMAENFAKIGVSFKDLESGDPAAILLKIADAAKKAKDAGDDFGFQADLVKVLDTESAKLKAFLEQGAAPIQAETERLLKEGSLRSEAATKALAAQQKALDENLARFNAAFDRIIVQFVGPAEALAKALESFVEAINSGSFLSGLKDTGKEAIQNASLIPEFLSEAFQKVVREIKNDDPVRNLERLGARPTRVEQALLEAAQQTAENTRQSGVVRFGR